VSQPAVNSAPESRTLQEYVPRDYDAVNTAVARTIMQELAAVRGYSIPASSDLEAALSVRPQGRFEVLRLHVDRDEVGDRGKKGPFGVMP